MSHSLHDRLRSLRAVGRRVEPDAAWVRATRGTLLMQAKNSLPTEPAPTYQTAKQFIRHFMPLRLVQFARGPVMATLSIFALALGGSIASVSAAERSLPGDFLYSLKLASEQARLALTPSKGEKLKLKVEFTTRRGEDLKQVAHQDVPERPVRVAQAAEILKRDLKTVKEQLEDVKQNTSPETVVEAAKLVDQKSNELVQTLEETKSGLTDETKGKVTEAQAAAADTGVKAIEVLVEKHQEDSGQVSKETVVQAIQDYSQAVADVTGDASLVASSTSLEAATATSSEPFQEAVEQMKTATQQAFAAFASSTAASAILSDGSTTSTAPEVPQGGASSSAPTNASSTTPP